MSKLESSLETTFNGEAAKRGFLSLKITVVAKRGFPDRTVIGKTGHIFFVELKRFGKEPQRHQIWWHKLLRRIGFRVYVCDNKEQAIQILDTEAKMARA